MYGAICIHLHMQMSPIRRKCINIIYFLNVTTTKLQFKHCVFFLYLFLTFKIKSCLINNHNEWMKQQNTSIYTWRTRDDVMFDEPPGHGSSNSNVTLRLIPTDSREPRRFVRNVEERVSAHLETRRKVWDGSPGRELVKEAVQPAPATRQVAVYLPEGRHCGAQVTEEVGSGRRCCRKENTEGKRRSNSQKLGGHKNKTCGLLWTNGL